MKKTKLLILTTTTLLLSSTSVAEGEVDSRFDRLVSAVNKLPDFDKKFTNDVVQAAIDSETENFPAELILSIAWQETRFNYTKQTNRQKVCGIMQTSPKSIGLKMSICKDWNLDPKLGFMAGITALETMMKDSRVYGKSKNNTASIKAACGVNPSARCKSILYYACGNSAFDGTCTKTQYPKVILKRMKFLFNSVNRES